ncbi:hypothetical protein [Kitasatospora sp. NPDC059571]|uniref:hypothetical protein n=1 Tax=Kitasatospora sp. NPDC059571 TaxID=3346871 RepID=UPI0036813D6F
MNPCRLPPTRPRARARPQPYRGLRRRRRRPRPSAACSPACSARTPHPSPATGSAAAATTPPASSLRRRLGELAARIATVTGPAFGYPQPGPGLSAADWPTAFTGMLHAVLADADRFGVDLPAPAPLPAGLPPRHAAALAEVRRPALVHFDAWEGNIVLAGGPHGAGGGPDAPGGWRIAGLIDGERAFFGDPLAELVGRVPLGAAGGDPARVAGVRWGGPRPPGGAGARRQFPRGRGHCAGPPPPWWAPPPRPARPTPPPTWWPAIGRPTPASGSTRRPGCGSRRTGSTSR